MLILDNFIQLIHCFTSSELMNLLREMEPYINPTLQSFSRSNNNYNRL